MPEIFMPRLSDTLEEGTLSQGLKKIGDQIEKGDIVAEIETDNATMELEAYDAGVLEEDSSSGRGDSADRNDDCAGRNRCRPRAGLR
jgi:hypothetical protein